MSMNCNPVAVDERLVAERSATRLGPAGSSTIVEGAPRFLGSRRRGVLEEEADHFAAGVGAAWLGVRSIDAPA